MEVVNKIKIDIVQKGNVPVAYAVQGESCARILLVSLFSNGAPFDTSGYSVSVAYKKPDGTSGWYDSTPNGDKAITITEDGIYAKLVPQMLSLPGIVHAAIRIEANDGSCRVTTFPFLLDVSEDPAYNGIKSENYYSVQNWDEVNHSVAELENKYSELRDDLDNLGNPGGGGTGSDGFSPIVDVSVIDGGHRITITDKEGENTFDVMDGTDGADGYSPTKGTDYWTEADKAEMVADVISALPVYNGEVVE